MKTFPSNMTTAEFLDWLRDSGIKGNMPPGFIDRIDEINSDSAAADELEATKETVDDLRGALENLVKAVKKYPRGAKLFGVELTEAEDVLESTK